MMVGMSAVSVHSLPYKLRSVAHTLCSPRRRTYPKSCFEIHLEPLRTSFAAELRTNSTASVDVTTTSPAKARESWGHVSDCDE